MWKDQAKSIALDRKIALSGNTDSQVTQEEIDAMYRQIVESQENILKEKENTILLPVLALNTDQPLKPSNSNLEVYGNIYIDDEEYYVKNFQKTEQINEYEYKIYQMYLLTENELHDKEEFTITLKNNKLVSREIHLDSDWKNNSEFFDNIDSYTFDLDGEIAIKVSKKAILEDSKIMEQPNLTSEFRNITIQIDKITVTPINTIIQFKHIATNQTTPNYWEIDENDDTIEWLPTTREYQIYDEDGNKLGNYVFSNWNNLIYEDGTSRRYAESLIPEVEIANATWETEGYLIIENTDSDKIFITPVETVLDYIDQSGKTVKAEVYYEMPTIEIDLK